MYPYALSDLMPTGKEEIIKFDDPQEAAKLVLRDIDRYFGFLECKISVPRKLWPYFEEMPPIFVNKPISRECIPKKMLRYAEQTGRKVMNNQKLVGSLAEDRILIYTPLLKWYIEHGLELEAVYSIIKYVPKKCFKWYVDAVTNDRRTGDEHPDKAIIGNNSKDTLNASIGKTIEALERHTNTIYTKNEKTVDKALRSAVFEDLTEIGDAYEIESRKSRIMINRPFQVGIAVYQLAKLRILEFYYDFLDHFVDRSDFELIQMDTDSLYFALSTDTLEEAIKPELREEFEAKKHNWLPWDKFSSRTPGLFKLEWSGHKMTALCSKCYHGDNFDNKSNSKTSSKGVSKAQNNLNGERYKNALDHYNSLDGPEFQNNIDKAVNRGFRVYDRQMYSYEQTKLGLSAYYDKRRVLSDGIHTEPLEYS